ncbi:hypothetical protein PFLUV_G00041580 [Perca fluviatilis]|uniref:Uncharacterized protein n=1 Tax=Perca fluviatilis TaxID=8168 RepID=A0A6A5F8L4_PERFL|nr:hypothetical protein PFLUV_G00041580 [Perca fluviatilis]
MTDCSPEENIQQLRSSSEDRTRPGAPSMGSKRHCSSRAPPPSSWSRSCIPVLSIHTQGAAGEREHRRSVTRVECP